MYYPPSVVVVGSLETRDANRIWQVAPRLWEHQFKDRQRVPSSHADQRQLQKLSIVAHLSRTLRAYKVDIDEQAWEKRVLPRMALAHDKYLRLMQNNIHEQFPERYTLRAGETCETHSSVYTRSLESLKPIPKNLVQRTQFCVMMDLTIPCDLPYDNVVPDVIVVTMPLSRLPEMAEVAVAMFAPDSRAPLRNHLRNVSSS